MASQDRQDATPTPHKEAENVEQSHPRVDEEQAEDGEDWGTAADTNDESHDGAARDWTGAKEGQGDEQDSDEHSAPEHEQGEQQPARRNAPRTMARPARRTRNKPSFMDQEDPYAQNQQMMAPQRQRRQQNEMYQPNQQVQQEEGKTSGGKDPLKLRLDLNLEIDIELKARIHGDLTLALLEGL